MVYHLHNCSLIVSLLFTPSCNILFFFPEFFKLMNEIENEDLVFTLETIVDKFGEEMAPYALGLCQNLVIYQSKCYLSKHTILATS